MVGAIWGIWLCVWPTSIIAGLFDYTPTGERVFSESWLITSRELANLLLYNLTLPSPDPRPLFSSPIVLVRPPPRSGLGYITPHLHFHAKQSYRYFLTEVMLLLSLLKYNIHGLYQMAIKWLGMDFGAEFKNFWGQV